MARGPRIRIAPCQYRDDSGIDTIVKYRGLVAHERWTLDSDPAARELWIAQARVELLGRHADQPSPAPRSPSRATLADDVVRFLKQREGRRCYAADKCNLKAWTTRIGPKARRRITTEDVNLAIAAWRVEGYSANTIICRCQSLRDLWRVLDGKRVRSPVHDAELPAKPHPHPAVPSAAAMRKVAKNLPRVASPRIVARWMVLYTCAQRPCQVERAKPEDIDLKRKTWVVRSAKGEPSHLVYLTAEAVAAWKLFIAADCWGQKVTKQYYWKLREAGYPKDISTYNYRHQAAQDASDRGADLGDIQGLLGHTDIETTRRTYGPLLMKRQKRIAKLMEGRL